MDSIVGLLYQILLLFSRQVLKIVGFFHEKTRLRNANDQNWRNPNGRTFDKKLIWFHCASLGEFEQGRPVLERFKEKHPDWQVLLTFFSPSGYEVRKNYEHADFICYFPLDLPGEVNEFLNTYRPNLAVFVKYEFWRNFSKELKKRDVPLISVSTILRPDQYFFRKWGSFGRSTLQNFDHFFVQNEQTAELLKSIFIDQWTIVGDTRFDRVADTLKTCQKIDEIERFKSYSKLVIGGSVWKEDMEVLMGVFSTVLEPTEAGSRKGEERNGENGEGGEPNIKHQTSSTPQLKFVIAPHEIDQNQIDEWISQIPLKCLKYSAVSSDTNLEEVQVLFIDSIGLLSSLYQYGDFAFIGGAYGSGLHNTLEAATFGMPIFFGDNAYHKFQEAHDLIDCEVAFPVKNTDELNFKLGAFLTDQELLEKVSHKAAEYVKNHTGASDMVLEWIEKKVF
ncbi:3-deoxy-D-manno-octulosonic acid transferase [Jiulongibacter sp. NS-SX5]|uniref:3-deoxy-D-manno-octulosonic acid transferase n=1 Tax=Jiulongibacter sp. NS-SX5 TaxID=3463854 RepID=UPI0040595CA9